MLCNSFKQITLIISFTILTACGGGGGGGSSNESGSLSAPNLSDAPIQTYTQDTDIGSFTFVNNGGDSISSCSADTLPTA